MKLLAMNMFLSEDSIKRHLEHLRSYRLKLSILEKSLPELKGRSMNEIIRMGLDREVKDEALKLIWYIKSHECFFDSFTESPMKSECINKAYSSREKFVYELYLDAMKRDYGFIYIYLDRGLPKTAYMTEWNRSFLKFEPMLALDLYEHSYFSDYGFRKDRYIRSALMYFDTGRLNLS